MKLSICLLTMLAIVTLHIELDKEYAAYSKYNRQFDIKHVEEDEEKVKVERLTPMEALDLVQKKYAVNFNKVYYETNMFEANENETNENETNENETNENEMNENETKEYETKKNEADDIANKVTYYYKLPMGDYYLVYEGKGATENEYMIHLYEFVIEEPEAEIGHMVTYGWYTVNRLSGEISVIEYWN